jgi:carbon starvation protein
LWVLFGAPNQLLAGLTLLAITVWLHQRRRRIGFTLWPMLFVLTTTLYALIRIAIANLRAPEPSATTVINATAAALLVGLALYLALAALRQLRRERPRAS